MQPIGQLDYLIMEALADMNKAPVNMERDQLDVLINDWAQYSDIVSWAAQELQCVAKLEETVNPIKSPEDLSDFQMEYSGLLKELGCPYSNIMDLPTGSRFDTPEKRKVLLNFVLSELEAARIVHVNVVSTKPKQLKVELDESPTAKVLREIIMELGLGKPPETITAAALWNNIMGKLTALLKTTGTLDPLFEGFLSPNQWSQIEKYYEELNADYQKRREMLLQRLDVTVQSFHWSDRLKGQKGKEIDEKFQKYRENLGATPAVKVSDILAARIDLPIVEKTASASVRKNTKSAINNVVIGRVPDRGGRTDEIQPPPPEMPPWQQRQGGAPPGTSGWIQGQGGQQSRGGGGQQHRGGGGRVQGGWSDSRGGGRGGGYSDHNQRGGGGRGGYNDYNQRGTGGGRDGSYNDYNQRGGGGRDGGYNDYNQQRGGGRDGGYNDYNQQRGGGRDGGYNDYNQQRGGGRDGGYNGYNQRGGGYSDYNQRGRGGRGGGRGGGGGRGYY